MKRGLCSFFANMIMCTSLYSQSQLNLIPWPLEVKQAGPGSYGLGDSVKLYCDYPEKENSVVLLYLKEQLLRRGIRSIVTKDQYKADIALLMRRMPTGGKPAYRLTVDGDGIRIESNFDDPGFYGVQTLLQLLPLPKRGALPTVPYVEIFDHARFRYRGMHMDVSRHFSGVEFIKKFIDYLAYHKMNVFHWHLTDDQGWRVEIKKYPELTSIGAWRNGTIIGRYPGTGNDNIPYGGYYTQDEIREVVAYAKSRFVEVIPEIDIPGHTSAAIAAYPFLSCFPEKPTYIPANMISQKSAEEQKNGRVKLVQETWGIFDDVLCAGKDSTFLFLEGVLDELVPLFPSRYFHMGGDECPKTHWKICPSCKKRIKEQGLKDEHELQSYFVQRIGKYLNAKGKTLIGWDEILEGGLAPNAVVMSWRGEKGAVEAAKQKHHTILSPQNPVYFDHTQSKNEDSVTIGGYNPLENVYAFEPVPKELSDEETAFVMGAQANTWREYIKNEKKLEYMIFPRMSALSEVLWSTKENRDWKSFEKRLPAQFERYEYWNANYSNEYYRLNARITPSADGQAVNWIVSTKDPTPLALGFFGRKDGIDKVEFLKNSFDKIDSIRIGQSGVYFVEARKKSVQQKEPAYSITQRFNIHQAIAKPVQLTEPASSSYPGDGALTIVNGIINEKGFSRAGEFLGWSGKNCEAIIDLGEIKTVSFLTVHALKRHSSWIWEPSSAEVFASSDGTKWYSLKATTSHQDRENQKITMDLAFRKTPVRYLKVLVKNYGKIPEGNPGAGRDAWLFIDEITVD